jgi:hypothetical protein
MDGEVTRSLPQGKESQLTPHTCDVDILILINDISNCVDIIDATVITHPEFDEILIGPEI